ncbi:hypothetical protein FACS1894187_14120 [Synergistales bacterium]|nr:hypothetical protein FACS1894187_14120 [Synergistales bacterium]
MGAWSWSSIYKYVWPPSVLGRVISLYMDWRGSNMKDKLILGVFFIPALLSVGGLLFCVAWFVLFNLPSFILSVLGWLLLTSIFSGAGAYCYDKIKQKPTSSGDEPKVTVEDESAWNDVKTGQKKWFEDVKKKWRP